MGRGLNGIRKATRAVDRIDDDAIGAGLGKRTSTGVYPIAIGIR